MVPSGNGKKRLPFMLGSVAEMAESNCTLCVLLARSVQVTVTKILRPVSGVLAPLMVLTLQVRVKLVLEPAAVAVMVSEPETRLLA